jgi:hypothetical protein
MSCSLQWHKNERGLPSRPACGIAGSDQCALLGLACRLRQNAREGFSFLRENSIFRTAATAMPLIMFFMIGSFKVKCLVETLRAPLLRFGSGAVQKPYPNVRLPAAHFAAYRAAAYAGRAAH